MQDNTANKGCLSFSKNQWIGIIAIATIIALIGWVKDATTEKSSATINVTISTAVAPGLADLTGCSSMADRFDITVYTERPPTVGTGKNIKLGHGTKQLSGSCVFQISAELPVSDEYGVSLNDHYGSVDEFSWVTHDGSDEVIIDVTW